MTDTAISPLRRRELAAWPPASSRVGRRPIGPVAALRMWLAGVRKPSQRRTHGRARQLVRRALSATKCRVGESDFGSSTNERAIVDPRLTRPPPSARTAQHGKDGRRRAHLNRAHDLKAMSLVERCI